MKPLFKCSKISRPDFFIAILVMASLAFSSGCDEKQGVKTGDTPPGISGTDVHGDYVSLNQFKGNVIVLYFWTKSCCGERIKQLEPYYSINKHKGLAILAINVGNTREIVESYAKDNGLTFTLQTDERAMTSREYGVFGFPTIFILDRDGVIRKKILGDIDTLQLEKLVAHYLVK
jgi:peroxiredoxin